MRPAPTTAIPSCLRSIMSLLGFDPGLAREAPLLLEFGPDVPGELLERRARFELDAPLDETVVQVRSAHSFGDAAVHAHENVAGGPRRRDQAAAARVRVAGHA